MAGSGVSSTGMPAPHPGATEHSRLAVLSVGEIQDLAEQIHALAKPLVGMDPQTEVRITVKSKADGDLAESNNVLNKIKPGWKL